MSFLGAVNAAGCKSSEVRFTYSSRMPGLRVNHENDAKETPACSGKSNGAIDIDVSYTGNQADLSYQWSKLRDFSTTFSTTPDLANAPSGTYYLKVSNKAGQCDESHGYHVSNFSVSYDSDITHPTTARATDGAIRIGFYRHQASAGFTYAWAKDRSFSSVISTKQDLTGVGAGTYYLRITQTDGNRCSSVRGPFTLRAPRR